MKYDGRRILRNMNSSKTMVLNTNFKKKHILLDCDTLSLNP